MRDLNVLLAAQFFEGGGVRGGHHNRHPFLRLTDSQFGTVDAAVFYRHLVEVYVETVGKFADSHAHAPGTEVVALLDEPHGVGPAEQPLKLPLFGGIAFLHLAAAAFERGGVVLLGCTGSAAYAVAAGAAAKQQHHVARSRAFPANCRGLYGSRHGPYLHALGHISRVDDFMNLARRKADLVAIAGITLRRLAGNHPLRKLAGHGFGNRFPDVSGSGHTHGLVNVGTPAQRVADGTSETGSGPAEGFYFGRMVMGFVLEHEKPFLGLPVHCNVDENAAGVVLFAHLHVVQQAFLPEVPAPYRGKVHQTQRLAFAAQFGAHVQPQLEALPEFFPKPAFGHFHGSEVGGEGGMAAVVAPVSVEDAELGFGGNAAFGPEIPADFFQVCQVHGEPHFPDERLCGLGIHVQETIQNGRSQSCGSIAERERAEVFLAAFYGIYLIMAHHIKLFLSEAFREDQKAGALDAHVRGRIQQPHAVACGSRTLVELSGQILYCQSGGAFGKTERGEPGLLRNRHVVGGLLGEYPPCGLFQKFFPEAFQIIDIQHPEASGVDGEVLLQLGAERRGLSPEARTLFYEYTVKPGHFDSGGRVILLIFSFCSRRKPSRRAERALSDRANISIASRAAFFAPLMATVATGTPEGICTVESRESMPPRPLVMTGTPITGSVV